MGTILAYASLAAIFYIIFGKELLNGIHHIVSAIRPTQLTPLPPAPTLAMQRAAYRRRVNVAPTPRPPIGIWHSIAAVRAWQAKH